MGDKIKINLDDPHDLWAYDILPEWAQHHIEDEQNKPLESLFLSQIKQFELSFKPGKPVELYPLTVFCLVQWLTAKREKNRFTVNEIVDRHHNHVYDCEPKYTKQTYRNKLKELEQIGLLEKTEAGKNTMYSLRKGKSAAGVFEDSQLYNVLVDSPTPKEEYQSTWVPLATRGRVLKSNLQGPFGTLFKSGFIFVAAGAVLSVGYADSTFLNLFDPTSPLLAVFGAMISFGIASMAVAVLDHISIQYDIAIKR